MIPATLLSIIPMLLVRKKQGYQTTRKDELERNWNISLEGTMPKLTLPLLGAALVAFGQKAIAQAPRHTPPHGMTCPGDALVWVNARSHIYHFQGERYFGSTELGKFMCERDARREGDRPTRNGQ